MVVPVAELVDHCASNAKIIFPGNTHNDINVYLKMYC